jgi:hypothetical protein
MIRLFLACGMLARQSFGTIVRNTLRKKGGRHLLGGLAKIRSGGFTMRHLAVFAGIFCVLFLGLVAMADDKKAADKDAGKKETNKKFSYIDIQPKTNHKLKDDFHSTNFPGNNLASLPSGEQTFEGVKFKIGEGLMQLGSKTIEDRPDKIEGIKVDKSCAKIHILHATGYSTDEDAVIGEYVFTFEDDTSVTMPIVYGKDVLDWWCYEGNPDPTRGKVAWKGENEGAKTLNATIRLYMATWENPKPDKKIKSIDFTTTKETPCAPFCVAMTVEEK